ncbi:Biopolymer transport protein ExbD/TolR [Pedobacter steynii]|uniref:Biopolymer transport protein ExbD/TolR n=1 Tax=Pedobacter steynii TaxID=430522 RepID=A0A1G9VZK2_9SPHI|nr:biopolymer transporter ExbD [Pedobacter steynii]NQX40146.1 biopolymer transporter ExbD [Pedobacter steynii]SDM77748.1 Biopolymer transport protein ExbD/TolR [Pedobacter steynii]
MPRAKVQRKSTAIDMTAMCDVSFLLLTFFILTATARQPDPLDVTIPSSTYKLKVPDLDMGILSIGKGKVFYEIVGKDVKMSTLDKMGEKYSIKFTPEERERFGVIGAFGVPVQSLKQFIMMSSDERTKSNIATGIPADSTNNQLAEWILQSRTSVAELHGTSMRVSIKGDAQEEYPAVKKIVDILQKQKINKFSLITSAEGDAK